MSTTIDFQHLYDTRLNPILIRMQYRRWAIIVLDLIIVAIILNLILKVIEPPLFTYLASGYGTIFLVFMRMSLYEKYRKKHRASLVAMLINTVAPEWTYYPGEGISYQSFLQSGLYRFSPASVQSNDFIEGNAAGVAFEFCTVKAIGQHFLFISTDKHKLAFSGIFIHANLFSWLEHSTYILPKSKPGLMGQIQKIKAHGKPIKTHNMSFDDEFDVYSTETRETSKLLVSPLFNALTDIKTIYGEVSLSLLPTGLHIGITMDTKFLNPQLYRSEMTKENIRLIYDTISSIPRLINQLKKLEEILLSYKTE